MDYLARKRLSIYMVLLCWGIAVSMMHPSFGTMLTGTILLFALLVLRFQAHIEGEYLVKAAEAEHGKVGAVAAILRHRLWEGGVCITIGVGGTLALLWVVKHVPWIWFPGST